MISPLERITGEFKATAAASGSHLELVVLLTSLTARHLGAICLNYPGSSTTPPTSPPTLTVVTNSASPLDQ